MRIFLVSEKLPISMETRLSAYGRCVRLPAFDALPTPVSHHPDMLMAKIGDTLLVHRDYAAGRELLECLHLPFRLSEREVKGRYPEDVALNCFLCGDCFFAKQDAVSAEALSAAKMMGKTPVHVRQGYAKCSTVVMRDALATADPSIFAAAKENGVPALLLASEKIGIEAYDTGFIGGACGAIDAHTLAFFGDIEAYAQGRRLAAFFAPRGVEFVSLGDGALFDYGGMIALDV